MKVSVRHGYTYIIDLAKLTTSLYTINRNGAAHYNTHWLCSIPFLGTILCMLCITYIRCSTHHTLLVCTYHHTQCNQ